MAETWQQKALEIGGILNRAADEYPELTPLCTSWMNYARKRNLHKYDAVTTLYTLLDRHGLALVPQKEVNQYQATINSQAEEIRALEYRINTLLNG